MVKKDRPTDGEIRIAAAVAEAHSRGYREGWRDSLEEMRRGREASTTVTLGALPVAPPRSVLALEDDLDGTLEEIQDAERAIDWLEERRESAEGPLAAILDRRRSRIELSYRDLLERARSLEEELRRQEAADRRRPADPPSPPPPVDPPRRPPTDPPRRDPPLLWGVELEVREGLWRPTPERWDANPTMQSIPERWDVYVGPGRVKRAGAGSWETGLEGVELERAYEIAGEMLLQLEDVGADGVHDYGEEPNRLRHDRLVRIELSNPSDGPIVYEGFTFGADLRWVDAAGRERRIRDVIVTSADHLTVDDEGTGRDKLVEGISISGMRVASIANQGVGAPGAREWPGVANLIFAGVNLETPKGSSDAFHVSGTHGLTHGALRFWGCANVPSAAALEPDGQGVVAYNGTGQKWGFKGSGAAAWEFLDCYWDRAEEHDVYAERPQGADIGLERHHGFWARYNRQAKGGNGRTSIQLTSRGAAEKHDAVPPGWKVQGATGDCDIRANVFRDNVSKIASGGSDVTIVGWPNGDVYLGPNLHAGIAATPAGPGQARGLITCWVDEFYGVIPNERGFPFRRIVVRGVVVATTGKHQRGLFKFSGAELVDLRDGFDIAAESSWPQVTLNAFDAGSSHEYSVERVALPPASYAGWNDTGPKVVVGVVDAVAPKGRRMVTLTDDQVDELVAERIVAEVVS